MQVKVESRSVHKESNHEADFEDAFNPTGTYADNVPELRCAMADGATESTFAQKWASLLVNGYVERHFDDPAALADVLPRYQANWIESVDTTSLSWFAKEKLEQGAFATFLSLKLSDQTKSWQSYAIGDTCLFHLRGGTPIATFPLNEPAEFSSFPDLLSSVHNNHNLSERFRFFEGNWLPGDQFLMATDAVACWLIAESKENPSDFEPLLKMLFQSQEDFEGMISQYRHSTCLDGTARLKNDDVSLLCVTLC